MRWLAATFVALVAFNVGAQSKNTWQELQPGGSNYVARTSGSYEYGWPACETCEEEPDVVLQYILDEASGSVVDEVASFTMNPTGAHTYEESAAGAWAGIAPGISPDTTTSRMYSGLTSAYGLGTDQDFVFEMVLMMPSVGGNGFQWVFGTGGPTFGQRGFGFWPCHSSGTAARLEIEPDDLSVAIYVNIAVADHRDGKLHKWRWAGTLGGDVELFIDGVSHGSFDTAAIAGKNSGSYFMYMFGWGSATFASNATVYEVRLTVGNKTNCSNSGGDCQ